MCCFYWLKFLFMYRLLVPHDVTTEYILFSRKNWCKFCIKKNNKKYFYLLLNRHKNILRVETYFYLAGTLIHEHYNIIFNAYCDIYFLSNFCATSVKLGSSVLQAGVFFIENHIFPKKHFEPSGKFHRPQWEGVPGINILEHIYREEPDRRMYHPYKMIVQPR